MSLETGGRKLSLQIIMGRAHSGKTQYILDMAKDLYETDHPFIIVVPEQFTHLAEKRLIEKIGCIESGKAEVLSFDRLARRVDSLYPSDKHQLDTIGKALIISEILSEIKLEYYKSASKLSGFVKICNDEISELKSYMVSPESLKNIIDTTSDKSLSIKLKDIYEIYSMYEERIKNVYSDSDDKLSILTDALKKFMPYKDVTFFFDEFSSFNPREREIISALSVQAKMLYVSFCADISPEYKSLFKPTIETADLIRKVCTEAGCKTEKDVLLTNSFYENREMCILEKYLYVTPAKTDHEIPENISITVAENPYAEVETVARKIISLIQEKGVRYRDIGIVCSDISSYDHIIRSVFDMYKIPYFIDEKVRVLDHAIISFVINILDVYLRSYKSDRVVGFLKSGCIGAKKDDIYVADNFILASNASKNTWLDDDKWKRATSFFAEGDTKKIKSLERVRDGWILPLAKLHDSIKGRHSVKFITEKIYAYLLDIGFDKTVSEYIKLFKSDGNMFLAKQYERVWATLIEAFDSLVYILGDTQVNLSEYRKYLYDAFDQQKTGIIPTTLDEIIVGDIKRTKSGGAKYQFVLGAVDGSFPSVAPDNGIITDEEKKKLSSLGVELTPDRNQQAYFDRFLIYSVLTHPDKCLMISYPASDNSFSCVRPAFVISIIQKMFPALKKDGGVVGDAEIYTENTAFETLISSAVAKNDDDNIWKDIYTYYLENDEEKLSYIDRLIDCKTEVDVIEPEIMQRMYSDEFYSTVSRLQRYNSCRYSYYLEYMLSLHEKKTYGIESTDVGTLIHSIIENAFVELSKENKSMKDADNDFFVNHIRKHLDEYLSEIENNGTNISIREEYFIKNLESSLLKSLQVLKQHLVDSKFVPLGHEITFDDNSIGCIEFELAGGKKVKITGKIDRADYFENENGIYYRIIDYKSGTKSFSFTDVFYGLDVQLLVYMNALVKKQEGAHPAGALFFRIKDPVVNSKSHDSDEKHLLDSLAEFKMDGVVSSEPNVLEAFSKNSFKTTNKVSTSQMNMLCDYVDSVVKNSAENIISGHIDINPYIRSDGRSPCGYCKYKEICAVEDKPEKSFRKTENLSNVNDAFEKISSSVEFGEVQIK
ncbi:MAG: hypothetical protein E7394_00850 [Ruminococcaceae bacterium]|nr:hypothetical protein [Oscillospiraceae bacterium]